VPIVLPKSGGRRGPLPALIEASGAAEEAERVAEEIASAVSEGTPLSDIAIFCRTRQQMRPIELALERMKIPFESMPRYFKGFNWATESVKIVTLHSCKGLEFPLAFVVGLQALPHKDSSEEDELRLLYVGMTRATQRLVLSTSAESTVVHRVRNALAALQLALNTPSSRTHLQPA
jgi:superfamily I DNA/RNA helicase